jgi:hypothetical protein
LPVLVALAIDCASISPRFSIASPSASTGPIARRRVPVRTRATRVSVSIDSTPLHLVQRDDHAIACNQRARRMPGAHHAHRLAAAGRLPKDLRQVRVAFGHT